MRHGQGQPRVTVYNECGQGQVQVSGDSSTILNILKMQQEAAQQQPINQEAHSQDHEEIEDQEVIQDQVDVQKPHSDSSEDEAPQKIGDQSIDQKKREKLQKEEKKQFVRKMKEEIGSADAKKSKMDSLLQHAEYYANFLLSHHERSKKNNMMTNSKRRGRFEDEEEEERHIIEEEEEECQGNTHLEKQPSILKGGQLKHYQMIGLNWLISLYESGINGILADDMGLGKTIQTISIIGFLKQFKKINGPHMVIAPKITLGNWVREFQKWLPDCKVVKLIATKEQRETILQNYISKGAFDVVVTSFEGARLCLKHLRKIKWKYLVIDEAHKIKNEQSMLSQVVRSLHTKNKLLLTGTPLQNNLHELWSLLNFIMPDIFDSSEVFDEWFTTSNEKNDSREEVEKKNVEMIQQLHKILRAFMIRRTKKEVEKSLPEKKEVHVMIGLTELQVKVYKNLLQKRNPSEEEKKYYLNLLIQLRKVCNHPYLFPGVEEEGAPILGEHIIEASGKMKVLDKLLQKLHLQKHQILIFSQMTMMLDILEDYCNFRGYSYCRIDGSTDMDSRDRQINEFQEQGSSKFIFLLSTRAGGLGINLTSADTVIIYDSDWNPQMDLQAMDRAHRIGQKNKVNVYRMICENTVEQKMIERQAIKLKWDSLVIQQGRVATQKNKILSKEEMKDMLQFGANVIFKAENGTFNDEMIDELLVRGEIETKKMNDEIEKKIQEHANLLNLGMNSINIFEFMNETNKEDIEALDEAMATELEKEGRLTRREKTKGTNYNLELAFKNGKLDKKQYKKVVVPEHHFYKDKEILAELLQKEEDYDKFKTSDPSLQPLTEEEVQLKEKLLATGFRTWTKQDFHNFIQGCEKFSMKNVDEIAKNIGKSAAEVKEYIKVFEARIDELGEKEKIKKQILSGEEKVASRKHHQLLLDWKGNQSYDIDFNPSVYTKFRSKQFTLEADKYLVNKLYKLGISSIAAVREAIRKESMFRFDQFFRSRTESELNRRMQSLYKLIEKQRDIALNGADFSILKDKETKKEKKDKKMKSKLNKIGEENEEEEEQVKEVKQTKLNFGKKQKEPIEIPEDD